MNKKDHVGTFFMQFQWGADKEKLSRSWQNMTKEKWKIMHKGFRENLLDHMAKELTKGGLHNLSER